MRLPSLFTTRGDVADIGDSKGITPKSTLPQRSHHILEKKVTKEETAPTKTVKAVAATVSSQTQHHHPVHTAHERRKVTRDSSRKDIESLESLHRNHAKESVLPPLVAEGGSTSLKTHKSTKKKEAGKNSQHRDSLLKDDHTQSDATSLRLKDTQEILASLQRRRRPSLTVPHDPNSNEFGGRPSAISMANSIASTNSVASGQNNALPHHKPVYSSQTTAGTSASSFDSNESVSRQQTSVTARSRRGSLFSKHQHSNGGSDSIQSVEESNASFTSDLEQVHRKVSGRRLSQSYSRPASSANSDMVGSLNSSMSELEAFMRISGTERRLSRDAVQLLSKMPKPLDPRLQHKLNEKRARRHSIISFDRMLSFTSEDDEILETIKSAMPPISPRKAKVFWFRALFKQYMLIFYRHAKQTLDEHLHTPVSISNEIDVLSRLMKGRTGNPNIVSKVKELLEDRDNLSNRGTLERLLSLNVRNFAKYPAQHRSEFCNLMTLQQFPAETVLIKEGHISTAFYFLLYGQVDVFKVINNHKFIVSTLSSGDSIGDRTMNIFAENRTASVSTVRESAFLKINKGEYLKLVNGANQQVLNLELGKIPIFANSTNMLLEKIIPFTKITKYDPNETIVTEGTVSTYVYWIFRGSCKCVKVVPFIRNTETGHLREYTDDYKLKKGEEVVRHLLTVCEMVSPDFFPNMPVLRDVDEHPALFNQNEYVQFLEKEDPSDKRHWCAASVIATSAVEVAVIEKKVFARYASSETLREAVRENHPFLVPTSQLSEVHLKKLRWSDFKSKVRDEFSRRLTKT